MSLPINKILQGDSLTLLKDIDTDVIDLLVTDPPYGYSFMGKDWDKAVPSVEVWKECLRVLKPGSFAFVMSAPRQDVLSQMIVRLGMAGFDTSFTSIYWTYASGFPKAANVGKLVDKRLGAEREVISTIKKKPSASSDCNEGWVRPWAEGKTTMDITAPATPQAKALDGSYAGFQPKPAVEVIIVAMKPLSEKTYVDQALANGKGITWLDDCRIPYQNEDDKTEGQSARTTKAQVNGYGAFDAFDRSDRSQITGRFPANLLVSDDVLNDGRITKSTTRNPTGRAILDTSKGWNQNSMIDQTERGFNDSGSYSRYFDLDKWAEKTLPFLIVPKASKSEKGGDNNHPTVKPLKLMSYLITMGSRPNDIVLDPFSGSGTVPIAARQLARRFIGIELAKEYAEIGDKRILPSIEQKNLIEFG